MKYVIVSDFVYVDNRIVRMRGIGAALDVACESSDDALHDAMLGPLPSYQPRNLLLKRSDEDNHSSTLQANVALD